MRRSHKYVHFVTSRGREYAYFRRYGERSPLPHPDEDYEAFALAYAVALNGAQPTPKGKTFAKIIKRYREHRRFKRLKPRTKADYERVLEYLGRHHGQHEVSAMTRPAILRMQDAVKEKRGYRFANYCVQIMSILLRLACDLGWVETNAASGVEMLRREDGRETNRPWPADVRERFERSCPPRARLICATTRGRRWIPCWMR